jgi:hypothetical protein
MHLYQILVDSRGQIKSLLLNKAYLTNQFIIPAPVTKSSCLSMLLLAMQLALHSLSKQVSPKIIALTYKVGKNTEEDCIMSITLRVKRRCLESTFGRWIWRTSYVSRMVSIIFLTFNILHGHQPNKESLPIKETFLTTEWKVFWLLTLPNRK